jgi:hypothetical protein
MSDPLPHPDDVELDLEKLEVKIHALDEFMANC